MADRSGLRPLERRMLRLSDDGVDDVEIAWRFRKSPRFVRQVKELATRPDPSANDGSAGPGPEDRLRPLERRLLWWRSQGLEHAELAPRFRRSAEFLARVEEMAQYKLREA